MLFMAGCSGVVMKEPFHESLLTEEEQGQLEGIWRFDGEVIRIAFASNGIPWIATVEWKGDDFVLNKSRLYFTKRNDSLYVCMPAEPGQTNECLFAEFRVDDETAWVWIPDVDVFEELIGNGFLEGSIGEDKYSKLITLENEAEEILELISTNHVAMDYKNPLVFQKLD